MNHSATGCSRVHWLADGRLLHNRPAQLLAILVLVLPRPVAPDIINVSGGCTLVDAVTAANTNTATGLCPKGSGADEIRLTADVTLTEVNNTTPATGLRVPGPNGLPQVVTDIVIEGNGHTIARGTGAPEFRFFNVYSSSGNLTLQNTTLSNGGGASFDYLGGAIANSFPSDLTLTNSTVSGNSAGGFSGGGGGIYNGGDVVITGSTISGNSAYNGGGLSNYGIATLTNSTLSANSGGTNKGGGIDSPGTVTLIHSTLSGNSGGGAINVFSGKAYLENTLLAASPTANCRTGSGTITDNGGNLADDTSCGVLGTLSDLARRLADNGGPTRTHALLEGSNAIGLPMSCPEAKDQRGATRPAGACDSGAYEFIACPDLELSETVFGTETREHCQRIVLGPDFIVFGSADLTLRAGSAVVLGNQTTVDANGRLTIEIDTDLQLLPPP
ncbi:MAG: hypothetical protein GY769_07440 [bacterium]|nr:hypothetical protein [bacterium]